MKNLKKMLYFVIIIIIVASAKISTKAETPQDLDMCTPNKDKANTECTYNFRVFLGWNYECMDKENVKCQARIIQA